MKHLLVIAALIGVNAFAQPVEIVTSSDGTVTWMAYPETLVATSMEYSVLAEMITEKSTTKRISVLIETKTCDRGSGVLYARETTKQPWTHIATVSMLRSATTADVFAQTLCAVGQDRRQKNSLKMT